MERELGPGGLILLSDLHLGEEAAVLGDPDVAGALVREMAALAAERGWPDLRVVILVDLLDLWLSDLGHALRAARPFLGALAHHGAQVDYVVGNHDHHVVVLLEEVAFARALEKGVLHSPRQTVQLVYRDTFLSALAPGLKLQVAYPHLVIGSAQGRRALLTHGHYLDAYMYFGLPLYLPKVMGLFIRGRLSEKKFEQALTAQYELLYSTSAIDDVRKLETRAWSAMEAFMQMARGRMLWSPRERRSMLRGLSLEGQIPYVRRFLIDRGESMPDLFVFGHTHRPGLTHFVARGRDVTLANTGTWRGNSVRAGTYAVLEDGIIELHRLGRGVLQQTAW